MTPDMVAELLRQLMKESMILAAPVLIAAALLSFLLSLLQTLTSLQEQSLTSVPQNAGRNRALRLYASPRFSSSPSSMAIPRLLLSLQRRAGQNQLSGQQLPPPFQRVQ